MPDVPANLQWPSSFSYLSVVQPFSKGYCWLSPLLSRSPLFWRLSVSSLAVPIQQIPYVPWHPCQQRVCVTQGLTQLLFQSWSPNSDVHLYLFAHLFNQAVRLVFPSWGFAWNSFHTSRCGGLRLQRYDRVFSITLQQDSLVSQCLQKVTEVLHRIRCRSLSVHKGSSHRRGSAVLYHQDGFCSPIFFPVHRHERVVAGYHWYPILCASLFISRAVLLTNTPTGHTVLAPCPVLHMSSAFMLLHLCWCRILWRPYLYRPCQFFHFHFFSNILGSARWIWIFLTSSGRGGRSQFLGRTYASFGCRPKPEFGLVSGPFR